MAIPAILAALAPQFASAALKQTGGIAKSILGKVGNYIGQEIRTAREDARNFGNPELFQGTGYKHGGNTNLAAAHNLSQEEYDKLLKEEAEYKSGGLNFKSSDAYKKWLAFGHASGEFAKTPGHQKVSIGGEPKKVEHGMKGGGYADYAKSKIK